MKRESGRGQDQPGDSYSTFKERLIEQLYEADLAEEAVIQRRIERLTENVRRDTEAELADEWAELQARGDRLAEQEAIVAAKEERAKPSHRARFVALGASLAVAGDLLIRVVA